MQQTDGLAALEPIPKKGDDSVGVGRQWCGRLGKIEGCQKGIFVSYARKGPLRVRAACVPVLTRPSDETDFTEKERLVVIETLRRKKERRYCLAHAADATAMALETLVRVAASRHHIEEALETAKGGASLAHYEVRSWVEWHHHMTLSLVAAWFLTLERKRLGGNNTGHHRLSNSTGHRPTTPEPARPDQVGRAAHHAAARPQRESSSAPLALRSETPDGRKSLLPDDDN